MASMPEVAIAEDDETIPGNHEVRSPRQPSAVQPISNSSGPKSFSQEDLRSGILTTIAGPNPAGRATTRPKPLVSRHSPLFPLGWHSLNVDDGRLRAAF